MDVPSHAQAGLGPATPGDSPPLHLALSCHAYRLALTSYRPRVVVPADRSGYLFRYRAYRFLMVAFAQIRRALEL